MKRRRIQQRSEKFKKRAAEARPTRLALVARVGCCEVCGTNARRPRHSVSEQNDLHCHEVLPGGLRQACLDVPSALIVACNHCNQGPLHDKRIWPLARQLALIKQQDPERYDRELVLRIRNPDAMKFVTEEDVDHWIEDSTWQI